MKPCTVNSIRLSFIDGKQFMIIRISFFLSKLACPRIWIKWIPSDSGGKNRKKKGRKLRHGCPPFFLRTSVWMSNWQHSLPPSHFPTNHHSSSIPITHPKRYLFEVPLDRVVLLAVGFDTFFVMKFDSRHVLAGRLGYTRTHLDLLRRDGVAWPITWLGSPLSAHRPRTL